MSEGSTYIHFGSIQLGESISGFRKVYFLLGAELRGDVCVDRRRNRGGCFQVDAAYSGRNMPRIWLNRELLSIV